MQRCWRSFEYWPFASVHHHFLGICCKSAGHELLDRCDILNQYSIFVEKVRNYTALINGKSDPGNCKEPMELAIRECIREGVLVNYLQRKGAEVVNTLFDEHNYDINMLARYEEGFEEGFEKGFKEAFKEAYEEAYEEAFEETIEEFRANTLLYAIRSLIETTKCSSEDAMEKLMIPAEDRAALLAQL